MLSSERKKTKKIIDLYTLALIKENLVYFILLIVNIALFVGIRYVFYERIEQKKKTIKETKTEIQRLQHIKQELDSISLSTSKIDELYEIANLLLPNKENIFSIIASLERLSQEANFPISHYSISSVPENSESTEITVESLADEKTFLRLLENYHFAGGRLKTIPEVKYRKGQTGVSITLVFHTKPIEESPEEQIKAVIPSEEDIKILEQIANKVYIDVDPTVLEKEYKYPTKDRIF